MALGTTGDHGGEMIATTRLGGAVGQENKAPVAPSHGEVERAIRSVPGVAEATVARAHDTGRGRLRIRLHPGEDAERVSWSVAATLRERFGIALDPDEIRPRVDDEPALIATPASMEVGDHDQAPAVTPLCAPESRPTPGTHEDPRASRPTIRDLRSRHDGGTVTVTVRLELEGRRVAGEAVGLSSARGLHRAIADATVRAVGALTRAPMRAQVDWVSVGGHDPEAVTVVICMMSNRREELLLGAAIVRDDVEHAVMRATLDALNRRMEPELAR